MGEVYVPKMTDIDLISDEFDALWGSLGLGFYLDEFEKSVYLTEAQEAIVLHLYSSDESSFEDVEAVRKLLNELIRTEEALPSIEPSTIDKNGKVFNLPANLWAIVYETVTLSSEDPCIDGKEVEVYPTTLDSFSKIKKNPFRSNYKNRALRLDIANNKVEIVTSYDIEKYIVRYLVKPAPIVLVDLKAAELNIEGVDTPQIGELNPIIRRRIVEEAVMIAKRAYAAVLRGSASQQQQQQQKQE